MVRYTGTIAVWASLVGAGLVVRPGECVAAPPAGLATGPATRTDEARAAWLRARVVEMGAPDLATREKATDEASGDARVTLAVLEACAAELEATAPGLSVEQRERLERVGRLHFARAPHGALGVSFGGIDRGQGVGISATIDGFDSRRALRAGDVMLTISGREVTNQREARAAIISHDPDEEVEMSVLRRGEKINVRVRLGSYQTLQQAAVLDDSVLDAAWGMRLERRTGRTPPPAIEPPLSPGGWARLVLGEEARQEALVRAMKAGDAVPEGGDEPQLLAGGGGRGVRGADPGFMLNQEAPALRTPGRQIFDQLVSIRNDAARVQMQLNRAANPVQRRELEQQLRQLRQRQFELEQKMRAQPMPGIP